MNNFTFWENNNVIYITDGERTGEFPLEDLKYFLKPVPFHAELLQYLIVCNLKWLLTLIFVTQGTEEYKFLDDFPLFQRMLGSITNNPEFETVEKIVNYSNIIFNLDLENYNMKIK